MEKTATLNLRVNPTVKKSAEEVLSRLGVPMSVAIDMYLNQIVLTGGIPFPVTLPKTLPSMNEDEQDLEAYEHAMKEYRENPKTHSHAEAKKMLELD